MYSAGDMTMNRLNGRVAIVTGAGRGIGQAIAQRFSQEGAAVVLAARTTAQIREAAREIESSGGYAVAIRCDVSKERQVERLAARVVQRFGRIDILVNNAGINLPPIDLTETDPKDWRHIVDVNLNGAFFCTRAVLPHMKERGTGVVLNISSVGGRRGGTGTVSRVEGGVDQLDRDDSRRGRGVRGAGGLPMPRRSGHRHDAADRTRGWRDLMKPEQIAEVAAYAVSDEAATLNGVAIDVPGNANTLSG